MKKIGWWLAAIALIFSLLVGAKPVWAFCGFYVAKADSKLYNQASQVILAREGDGTVLTMANDYQGEAKDFALVVPVPVVLSAEQVNIGEAKIIERLDSFTAPRLVEYFDSDPCQVNLYRRDRALESAPLSQTTTNRKATTDDALGVTIESKFSVGEYDILILSAKESSGLETWLISNGYKLPRGASKLLQPYIRQNLKFFVAKVNLEKFADEGFQRLRPLMIAYESPRFMLPIRLGTMNAAKEQDLLVYLLSPAGQIELTNYRTVKIPSNNNVPEFVEQEFSDFYTSMFNRTYKRENKKVAFLEYAWNMASCDPCAANPLNREELKQAGVFWLNSSNSNVFVTRLHVRYNRRNFPEDLKFQTTSNRELFQGRYVIRHPFRGEITCDAGKEYKNSVRERQEQEAITLAKLTGWDIQQIREKINFFQAKPIPWWRKLWR